MVIAQPVARVYVTVAGPVATPVTIPEAEPTVAIETSAVLQVPPPTSVNVVVDPTQIPVAPVIGVGNGFTVTNFVTKHPVLMVYEMVTVPPAAPETTPVVDPTVAMPPLLLLHVPPPPSVNVMVDPWHTTDGPEIDDGSGSTVTGVVVMQPVGKV